MAVQAEAHIEIVGLGVVHLRDVAVTAFARDAGCHVRPMIKLHKVGLIIDFDPLHRPPCLPVLDQLVDIPLIGWVLGLDIGVAAHALGQRWQAGHGSPAGAVIRSGVRNAGRENFQMNTKNTNTTRGFLDLVSASLIAGLAIAPLAIALALDIADSMPGTDYPASIYAE